MVVKFLKMPILKLEARYGGVVTAAANGVGGLMQGGKMDAWYIAKNILPII